MWPPLQWIVAGCSGLVGGRREMVGWEVCRWELNGEGAGGLLPYLGVSPVGRGSGGFGWIQAAA